MPEIYKNINIEEMKSKDISVVIPAYNEESQLQQILPAMNALLSKNFNNFEIIVVDDGSCDRTYKSITQLSGQLPGLKVLRNEVNLGKGYSVRRGVLSATYEYILFTDADLSTPMEELGKFINCLSQGADIAIASRALPDSKILKRQRFLRRNMGRIFNIFVQLFLFAGIKDTQCGFKCFKRDVARILFKLQKLNGFCFDAEILYIAKKRSYAIKEISVIWINRDDSRVSIIKNSIKMFMDIFQIRLNAIRRCYK